MITLHGSGVGKGIAIGTALILDSNAPEIPEYTISEADVDTEVRRFETAIRQSRQQLLDIAATIPEDAPSESASFLDAYLLMLQDPVIAEQPKAMIRDQRCNAEAALGIHSQALADVFDAMQDAYLRSKKTDVQHVVDRIQRNLLNIQESRLSDIQSSLEGRIVVARDLSPADTVQLKHHKMIGFATDLGGPIAHTAILARSLKIPAIVGLHGATRYIRNGEQIIVDGKRGVIIVNPDERILAAYRDRREYVLRTVRDLDALRGRVAETMDGVAISLLANIELPDDIRAANDVKAGGVGLYRTEYLFMNRSQPPSEAEQYAAYCRVLRAIRRPVTIRTLDLGADKQVDGGRRESPTNPALGLRAVRLCLHDPSLFRPQLRAILRAAALGPVQMMIPMVSSLDEMDQVLDFVEEVKQELRHEKKSFQEHIPIGGMIEVPAAAVAADLFARKFDFLSIGTNDLIQYTLAIDRVDDAVNYLYDPVHPSVLRLIKMTIDAGNQAEIPVAMCGEMAGDATYTRLLMGLGLRVFSMDPTTLLEVKKKILSSDLRNIEATTKRILSCEDSRHLHDLVNELNQD